MEREYILWFDNWCDNGPLLQFVGEYGPRLMGIPVQASLVEAYTSHDWHRHSRIRNAEVVAVREILRSMQPPSDASGKDTFMWGIKNERTSDFSATKTWDLLRPKQPERTWFKAVWFKKHVPKHSFNFWATNMNRLPLNVRLARWGLNVNPACTFCHLHDEK